MDAPDAATCLALFDTMTTIKQTDERFRTLIGSGQIFLMYYSPRGQEAIAAAIGAALRPDDYLVTTYRGLHDQLAKGVSLRSLWAEFLGRSTGPCRGKGGPMHLTDRDAGVMVTTGIVGSGLPIANGLALAAQHRSEDRVTVVCFGDGATSIGAFHEALNLASLWSLPVVFVCQNNGYAEMTSYAKGQPVESVAARAPGYGLPGATVDGNDPVAMLEALSTAAERARSGAGPTLIEASTYRFWGHYFGDAMTYMPPEEREAAMTADPVSSFRARLIADGHATEEQLTAVETAAEAAIDDAVAFALDSPFPDEAELDIDVYAEVQPA